MNSQSAEEIIEHINHPIQQLSLLLEDEDVSYNEKLAVVSQFLIRAADAARTEAEHSTIVSYCLDLLQEQDALIRSRTWEALDAMCVSFSQRGYLNLLIDPIYEPLLQGMFDKNPGVKTTVRATLYTLLSHPQLADEQKIEMMGDVLESLIGHTATEQHRIEALALIADLCPEFAQHPDTLSSFVKIVTRLAADPVFRIRLSCAMPISALAQLLDQAQFESELLPVYQALSSDEIWGVRKACAETLGIIAQHVSAEIRLHTLTPLFHRFAQDMSRWVRTAAFAVLGLFISTFVSIPTNADCIVVSQDDIRRTSQARTNSRPSSDDRQTKKDKPSTGNDNADPVEDQRFNTHQYWKEPLPELDVDEMMAMLSQVSMTMSKQHGTTASSKPTTTEETDAALKTTVTRDESTTASQTQIQDATGDGADEDAKAGDDKAIEVDDHTNDRNDNDDDTADKCSTPDQEDLDLEEVLLTTNGCLRLPNAKERLVARPRCNGDPLVVPSSLLDTFKSMTSDKAASTIDTDVARHCAFSFPGVVWAVGADGWSQLKDTASSLVSIDDWKVRACVASSLHHVAQIIGPALAETDLLPHFDFFMNDWDEVRSKLLEHLAEFLSVLPLKRRQDYLPLLADLKQAEDNTMWRNRLALAKQLPQLCHLYLPQDVFQFLCPLALDLAADPVAAVRKHAAKAVGVLLACLEGSTELQAGFTELLMMQLGAFESSNDALTFLQVCACVAHTNPVKVFEGHFLETVLRLKDSTVVNVRLRLAVILTEQIDEGYWNDSAASKKRIDEALAALSEDSDADICHVVTGEYPDARVMLTGPSCGSIDRTTDSVYSATGLARQLNLELAGNQSDDSSLDMVLSEDEAEA
eukprot:TRINITY_DN11262_c0_g1_i4.p1 TRINITY_DN11262_c0_g1~~TRINITY_DN11262_c0_g1_i4.p1  ORF type:complete len:866 (+),score=206.73 TRINITY_DN11262_c0_g1_i4:2-2599(+)